MYTIIPSFSLLPLFTALCDHFLFICVALESHSMQSLQSMEKSKWISHSSTTTSAVTVILIVSFAVSCWRLFISLRTHFRQSISIVFSLSFSFLCSMLVLHIDTPTAILNALLLFHMHLITPIRYLWHQHNIHVVEQYVLC